jgi:hypothetical protein
LAAGDGLVEKSAEREISHALNLESCDCSTNGLDLVAGDKVEPSLAATFEVEIQICQDQQPFELGSQQANSVRNRTLTLIEREDDTRSWGNFLVYFLHFTTMPCPPRGWRYILIGC